MDILTLDHNFGKEIETSANQLFNFFCNNVNLGQWQIAKTCLKQLIQDKKLLFVNFDSVFSSIIKHPENALLNFTFTSGASLSIKSPFYFSRLLCQTILEIYPDFLIENNLQDLIELRIIFYSHFDKISNNELEEIVNDAKNFDSEIQLKSPTLEFIKNIKFNDVLKAKNLLNLILLKNPNIEYCLIEFHLKLLSESLNTFESNVIKAKDTLNESTSDIFSLINLLLVYQKLNSLTFNSNRKFELIAMTQRFFRNTCFKLREIFSENLQHLELNITKVQLALLDRYKSSPLLELFTKINYEIDRQAIISKSFNDESLVVLSIIKHSLSNKKTDSILWKKLFLFTLVEKRCLPIILLIGISRVKDINSAKKLVNILSSNNSKETLVDQIGNFLKTHLDFVNWFFQQNRLFIIKELKLKKFKEF
ncbi:zinc finger FYVE domain-containing 26-like [Brachionus plicatilis]|uniref:Zinc finger FYVE domain-containing 26-like n=1 Tax=Brachionus plicatilis TaxID=10195 RepID=A0A3M7QYA8_BRAPC|nr:zinc finger FYVE domain-containing 26-like [Brachionus plicatilis]